MTNSGPDTAASPAPDASGEARPQWRFSGRRGTPVHLRDQPRAPQLPEEIRQTVAQMGREAATPSVTGLGSAGVEQTNGALRQPRSATPASTPVVAGAVVPVERRAPRTSTPTQVSTTPLEAVPVAAAAIPSPEAAVRVSDEVADLVPPTELPSAPPLDATAPETPQIETPELETPDVQPTAPDTSDDAPSLDAPATAGEPATAEAEQPSPATPAVAAKPKLSKAEQVKRAKARAKREREEAKQRDAAANAADTPAEAVPTVDPADSKMGGLKRKLFGRGAKQSPAVVETTPPVEADANVAPLAASASDLPPAGTPLQAAPEFDLSVEEPAAALIPPAAADAPFAFPTATPITDDAPLGAPQKFAPPEPSAAVDLPAPRPLAAIPVLPPPASTVASVFDAAPADVTDAAAPDVEQEREPATAAAEPVAVEVAPEPAVVESEPAAAEAEPEPEPAVAEPEPVVAEAEPEPAVAVAEPEPAVAESEPEPAVAVAEPEPAVVEAEPEPAVAVAKTELEPPVVEADVEPAVAETETESLAVPSVDDDLEARIAAAIELEIPAATAEPELLDLPSGAPGVQVPDSTSGLEAATQAVWDLNRLPFLLPQAAAPEAPAPVADLLPTPSTVLPPAPPRARARTSVTLQDVDLAPRMPVTAAELPQGRTEPIAAPIAIARLDAPLFAPGMVPTERPRATNPGEARARIAERRAQLAATMAELAALGSDDTRRS